MSTELVPVTEKSPRRMSRNLKLRLGVIMRPRRGTHRVWDRLTALQRDLRETQALNLRLTEMLSESMVETTRLQAELDDTRDKLRLATVACEANTSRVDFRFEERDVDPVDQPTHPVPVMELLPVDEEPEPESRDGESHGDTGRRFTDTVPIPVIKHAPAWAETTEMPVIRQQARERHLHASQSTTGTFRVMSSPFATLTPAGFPGSR